MIVQKLRVQRGWTQEQLAIVSGLSTRTIQRIERGQEPSLESLKALAAVFDVDFQSLKEPVMKQEAMQSRSTAEEVLAFEHVRNIKRLYFNLISYCVIISALFAVNYVLTPRYLWAVFPAIGWGIGLLLTAIRVFNLVPFWNGKWERRQVEKYLGRKL